MKILSLETRGVRALPDQSWSLSPDGATPLPLVVVTGPPSSGLTTLLESVAWTASRLATGGVVPDADEVLRSGGSAAVIRSAWWLDEDERRFGGLAEEVTEAEVSFKRGGLGGAEADPGLLGVMSRYAHTPRLSKVVLFPALRVAELSFPLLSDLEAELRFSRLASDPRKFAGFGRAVVRHASGQGDAAVFAKVQELFAALCDSTRLAGVGSTGQPEFAAAGGGRVPLARLSFTERNAFVLAAAPALMGLDRSVVLLDTPEMGLPPGVAARWVAALRSATPDAQWIVASRDPELVGSVAPEARVVIERRRA